MDTKEKAIYFTFDDGPHPEATPFVLDELKKYNARATFFCIGKNVVAHPDLYRRIIEEGHSVGNHTQNHLNGWKTKDSLYLADVLEASKHIDTTLFRPPYGRITKFQGTHLKATMKKDNAKVIMWDVLSGDFDTSLSSNDCLENVILNARNGSIIVYHDSEKALERMMNSLPAALNFFEKRGIEFRRIEMQ
jgi:peptidoglycan/xylan/chitin deacetylase (PgdA/CDA1 family)